MPLIEYQCPNCGYTIEKLFKRHDEVREQIGPCIVCDCIYMDKIISTLGYRRDQTIHGE